VAANSGARIGLAQEVKESYRVAWKDPECPQKGFQYLYVDADTFKRLNEGAVDTPSVVAKPVEAHRDRYELTDIIGRQDGLGVENLRGSGMIAGETSLAYQEVFTATLVTGRTVGIGAYLVRLGQRTVQNEGPIILTGASALNKVLGREVYSSNGQLGGPQIMYTNGVTHLSVHDELKGVCALVRWLSYVPCKRDAPLPTTTPVDPPTREIAFRPSDHPYDVRHMLAGCRDEDGQWVSGFFDRDSFTETLGGWARTTVCGRARLGGVPVGVVAVETRSVELVVPADPANQDSQQTVSQQAGQVWFPNSAFKTAQAIRDFNKGEQLPLFVFANWRGFSGGMSDMFDEVLKFGADIVDALREYRRPVFVYLPPHAELRGGAWAVLDPTINPEQMEMYADPLSRGGVLEPSGTVEIKYRRRDLVQTMQRLDPKLAALHAELAACTDQTRRAELSAAVLEREDDLLPIYQQVATRFADLHDTPGRMFAKGVISAVVEWAQARHFFYGRLCRRLAEDRLCRQLLGVDPQLCYAAALKLVRQWLQEARVAHDDDASTQYLLQGGDSGVFSAAVQEHLNLVHQSAVGAQVRQILSGSDVNDVAAILRTLPAAQLSALRAALEPTA